jgi:two-component system OmpR family response regulator/two-component system response regulator MprA
MLTALDAVEDRVAGLRAGADDYLPKPFAFDELLARVEALLRRAALEPAGRAHVDGPLTLDPATRTCICDGQTLDLTAKEFDLLAYFLARKDQVLSRDEIHRDVWGLRFDRGTNLIDVYVGYVRRKLAAAGCSARVETVRGSGYRYRPAEAPGDAG